MIPRVLLQTSRRQQGTLQTMNQLDREGGDMLMGPISTDTLSVTGLSAFLALSCLKQTLWEITLRHQSTGD